MGIFVLGIFENDPDNPLDSLAYEKDTVKRKLRPLMATEEFTYNIEYNLGLREVNECIRQYQNKISWFHFSGHHDPLTGVRMKDGNLASLADQLSDCPNLKGVFINGCASQETVNRLAEIAPICIGTRTPVYDGLAAEFSIEFYSELNILSKWNSFEAIYTAYKKASGGTIDLLRDGHIENTVRGATSLEAFRNEVYMITPEPESVEFYENAKQRWESMRPKDDIPFEISTALIKKLNELNEHGTGSKYHEEVPYILGRFIKTFSIEGSSKLNKCRNFGSERFHLIKEYFFCYFDLSRYVILSILWDEIQDIQVTITNEELINLLCSSEDYDDHRLSVLEDLCEQIINKFGLRIEKEFIQNLTPSFQLFQKGLKLFSVQYGGANAAAQDREAEQILHDILVESKFLNPYKLQSIHSRHYLKYRTDPAHSFEVQYIESASSKFVATENESDIRFVNVHSVYLYKSGNDNEIVIDLSPFYIDKNSYESNATKMDLMVLSRFRSTKEMFKYKFVYNPLKEKIQSEFNLTSRGFDSEDESKDVKRYLKELSKFKNVYHQFAKILKSNEQ